MPYPTNENLGAAIINSGRTFASFSESLPHPRYEAAEDPATSQDLYRRKHNPAINWINFSGKRMPGHGDRFAQLELWLWPGSSSARVIHIRERRKQAQHNSSGSLVSIQ